MSVNVFKLASSVNNCYNCKYDSLDVLKYEFGTNGDLNGWDLSGRVYMFGAWDNSLFGYASDRDCYVGRTENFLPLEAEHHNIIRLTMKVVNNNTTTLKGQESLKTGRVKWISLEETLWDDLKYQDFTLHTDGLRHTYTIDLGPNSSWVGNIIGLRIYPFVDGWVGDAFYISSIRLGSSTSFSCSNEACNYNIKYTHPCKGAGSPGAITSVPNESNLFTTMSGVSDEFCINIDDYGYESFNLGTNINVKGYKFVKILNRAIASLGMGSYAYSYAEYTADNRIKISSGSSTEGGNIKIKDTEASRNMGFYNEVGADVSIYGNGTNIADGFSYLSTRLLTAEELFRLIDGDYKVTSYTHTPALSCLNAGRADYYNTIKETVNTRINSVKYKISYKNRLKTIIDITHPIDSNGILKFIGVGGEVTEEDQAKAFILRPLKNGTFKVIYTFDFVNREDYGLMSQDPMFYKIECNHYVQKGDVVGFYNISLFYGRGKRVKPDACFYHISGEAEGTFDPGELKNYGVAGFSFHCGGESNQKNIVLDIDFGNRLNIKNVGVFGKLEETSELCNICLCEDVDFTSNLYGGTHKHAVLHGYITHSNKSYGLEALTNGIKTADNGIVGDTYGSDSNGLWTAGEHSYFYVNGDDEFADAQNPAQDFDEDLVELTALWDYNAPLKISKIAIYFKDSYNFRNMEISYYLGYYDASGDSRTSSYFKKVNYNKVYLDGVLQDKEKNAFIYQNPLQSKPLFERGVCINGDVIRTAAGSKWFLYECEFDPVDSYGIRIFTDHHKSTKIMEVEVYADYGIENTLNNAMYLRSSKEGDYWSDTEFLETAEGEFVGVVGDSPRYLQFEISSSTRFDLNEISAVLDDNIKSMDCTSNVLLSHAKNKTVNKSTPITFKNTYDVPLDVDVTIEKEVSVPNKLILSNDVDSYNSVENSNVGAGGFVEKYMDSFDLRTYYGNIAAGAKVYCLKSVAGGKKYYYKQGDCEWKDKGLISDNGYMDGVSRGYDWKRNRLEFDVLYGKYFEIGVYSPTYESEIGVLKMFYGETSLPIKKVMVGLVDSYDDYRVDVACDSSTGILDGDTVFKDDFNTGALSSIWSVENTTIDGVEIPNSLHVDDEGLRFSVSWDKLPTMTATLDHPVKDFELVLDIERDLLCEEDIIGDQWYWYNATPIFRIEIEFLDINNEVVGSIIPLDRQPIYVGKNQEDSVKKVSTHINATKTDIIHTNIFPKSKLNIKKIGNMFYIESDLSRAHHKYDVGRKVSFKNEYIHKIKIYFGRGTSRGWETDAVLYYGDKQLFDDRVYTPGESIEIAQTYPAGYLKYILRSIEIKSIPSIMMYKRLYVEFENDVFLNNIDMYAKSFRIGRPIYEDTSDDVALIGISCSNDGFNYNMVASSENEIPTYCIPDSDRANGYTNGQRWVSRNCFDSYVPTPEYSRHASDFIGGLNSYYIQRAYGYLDTYFDLGTWFTAYVIYDFGECNRQVFDQIEILSTYIGTGKLILYGSNDNKNWDSLYVIEVYQLHPNYDPDYVIIIEDYVREGYNKHFTFERVIIDDFPQTPYRYIRILRAWNRYDAQIFSINFKLKMSENTIQISYHDYEDWIAIDLSQQHSIGWIQHFNERYGHLGYSYNYLHELVQSVPIVSTSSENVEYSSTETTDVNEVVWGSNPGLEDKFFDCIYDDNWEITSVSGGMVHEDIGFLEVYSYGEYSSSWHGVTITHNFDKAEYIDFKIEFSLISAGTCKGRTSVIFKDVNGAESLKLVTENIDDTIVGYLYDNGILVYTDSESLNFNSKNTIRLKREVMPTTLKYLNGSNILYESLSTLENKINRLDITFERYELYTVPAVHSISYVYLKTVADLEFARWLKIILYNTAKQIHGNNIAYLGVYPDITKVSTPDGKVNCEWEQFPYSLTQAEVPIDLAKFKSVKTNYPQFKDYEIGNVINGETTGNSGLWAFDILDNGDFPYLEIDLGQNYDINEVVLHHGRHLDDTEYINANVYTEDAKENYIPRGTITFKDFPWTRNGGGYVISGNSVYYEGYNDPGFGWQYPEFEYTDKMLLKTTVYVEDPNNIPVIFLILYEDGSVKNSSAPKITVSTSRLEIDANNINNNWADATCVIEFNTSYKKASGIELICSNSDSLTLWGIGGSLPFYAYTVGLNSCLPLPCSVRDAGYTIEYSTTVSGNDFKYLCPIESKVMRSVNCGTEYSFHLYSSANLQICGQYCYRIIYGGNRYDRSHYYQNMEVRRLRIIFKKWEGGRMLYEDETTGESEVFTGSFLRGIEVFEEVTKSKIDGVMTPLNLRIPYSIEPSLHYINSASSPIVACDLGEQYNIKTFNFKHYPVVSHAVVRETAWQLYSTDIRYSDSTFDDPSSVKFSEQDQKEEIFYSEIDSGVLSYPQEGEEFTTEVELGSSVYLDSGVYSIFFDAYNVSSTSKMSFLFTGNEEITCFMTTSASGIYWESFEETVDIEDPGYYTIIAEKNQLYEEDWGIRYLRLSVTQGIAKRWVSFINLVALMPNYLSTNQQGMSFRTGFWGGGVGLNKIFSLYQTYALKYFEIYSLDGNLPTTNSIWWESELCELSTEKFNLKENSAGIRIDYPESTFLDRIRFVNNDFFRADYRWNVENVLSFWLYVSNIDVVEMEECLVVFGNEEHKVFSRFAGRENVEYTSGPITYYGWYLTKYNIVSGWNKVQLCFDEADITYPSSIFDNYKVNKSIAKLLNYRGKRTSSFSFYIKGKGESFHMILDTLKYERRDFVDVGEDKKGLLLLDKESLRFNLSNLSLKYGTIEFDVKLTSNSIGADIFGDIKSKTLLSLITNTNEIMSLIISAAKGFNMCVGTMNNDMIATDAYYEMDNPQFFIERKEVVSLKVVWSHDGTGMNNNNTFRLYVNEKLMFSIDNQWAITSNFVSSIVFGGATTAMVERDTNGSGIFFNIKVYNYCKIDEIVNNEIKFPNDFLEISKDDENFYNLSSTELPLNFKGIDPGKEVTVYIRADKTSGFKDVNSSTGEIMLDWILIV